MSEAQGLLAHGAGPSEPVAREDSEKTPRRAIFHLGVLCMLGAVAVTVKMAATESSATSAAEGLPVTSDKAAMPSESFSTESVNGWTYPFKIFKRTMASADADADIRFVLKNFGMALEGNYTYNCWSGSPGVVGGATDSQACASRGLFQALASWSMHYFQSHVTPQGGTLIKDWAAAWAQLHEFDAADGYEWDEFVPQGVTFYTSNLTLFLERWETESTPVLLRTYEANDGDFYSARVNVPHSGHIIEVISGTVGEGWSKRFRTYGDSECPPANVIWGNPGVEQLEHSFYGNGGLDVDEYTGLPDLLIIGVSQPSENIEEMPDFLANMTNTAGLAVNRTTTHASEYGCSFSDTRAQVTGEYDINIRMVYNPRARKDAGGLTVASYEKQYSETLDAIMGCSQSYGRFADSHLGMYAFNSLDDIGELLCEGGVGFTTAGSNSTNTGSDWSRGASGLGVEFQSNYDYSYFSTSKVRTLDYCSYTGVEPYWAETVETMSASPTDYCPVDYLKYSDDDGARGGRL